MPLMVSSTIWVTRVSTTAAAAQGYAVSTETTGGSISGYSLTGSRSKLIMPHTTSSRLKTVARTGRRMDTSERIMELPGTTAGFAGLNYVDGTARPDPGKTLNDHLLPVVQTADHFQFSRISPTADNLFFLDRVVGRH